MQKILLTSTGFGNKAFESLFLRQITKPAQKARVIFVPTAPNKVLQMIDHAYEVVVAKLPKYIQSEIKDMECL